MPNSSGGQQEVEQQEVEVEVGEVGEGEFTIFCMKY